MRALAFVGVRLMMLYVLVISIVQFSGAFPSLLALEAATWKLVLGGVLVILAGPMLVMVLFMMAGPVSRMLVPDQPADSIALDLEALERALFATVGLYFAIGGLVELSRTGYFHWQLAASGHHDVARVRWGYVSPAVQAALGTAVLFGARGLQGFVSRLRTFGLSDK